MSRAFDRHLGRRERQVMEAVYRLGRATAADVAAALDDQPGVDTVRVTLRNLEKKGHVRHRLDGRRHTYVPVVARSRATLGALRSLTRTFFGGSPSRAILAMLDLNSSELSQAELDEIARWIGHERAQDKGKKEGRS